MQILRLTRQRQAVLEVIQNSLEHPDASRVFELVRVSLPNISLGTVYRSLEVLSHEGHLVKLAQPGKPTRYDARLAHHYHLVCDTCGHVFDVTLTEMPDLCTLVAHSVPGFQVLEQRIEFHGVCTTCTQN